MSALDGRLFARLGLDAPPSRPVASLEIRTAAARLFLLERGGGLYANSSNDDPVIERYERRAALVLASFQSTDPEGA